MSSTSILSTIDQSGGEAPVIFTVHHEIVEDHILSRLDGVSLASLSCTCSYFHPLSAQERLWRKICSSTWPSTNDPRISQIISSTPKGYCRFFSDCFPLLTPYNYPRNSSISSCPSELISAVDICFHNKPILSRVLESETSSEWFLHSPFRVDLLDPKEVLPTQIKMPKWDDDFWRKELDEHLTLSWIILDPTTKKSANFSSVRPVSVESHWLTGEFRVEYATILVYNRAELVECKAVLMCGGLEQGDLQVKEVCMKVKDMDGKHLNGKDSLVSMANAIEFGKRKRGEKEEARRMHEEYVKKKKLRRDKRVMKERMLEMASVVGLLVYVALCLWYLIHR